MRSPFIEASDLDNRLKITDMMEARGFVHFPFEFWHYNQGDAMGHILSGLLAPARYGPVHWDPQTNAVTPYDDALSPLNPVDIIQREIVAATERLVKA